MKEIPAISFKDGQIVVVNNGEYEKLKIEDEETDLSTLMNSLEDYDQIYLVDINGIESNRPQMELIHKLSTRREIWADCGVNDMNTLLDIYVSGADRVVISTKSIEDISILKDAVDISDSMIFTIDIFEGEVLSPSKEIKDMGMLGLVNKALDTGIELIVISNLSDGPLNILNLRNAKRGDHHIYIGGNVDMDGTIEGMITGRILGLKEVLQSQKMN